MTTMQPLLCVGGYDKQRLAATKAAGFTKVELSFAALAAMSQSEREDYLGTLDELGLTPVAANGFFGQGLGGFFEDCFDLGKMREYIARAFEVTSAVRWESLAFGSGYMRRVPEGYPMEKAYDFMARFLSDEFVPMLEKYDTYLNIEELQTVETNFVNSCRDAAKLVEAIHHPRVGILCDFYHMSLAGETAADVPDFGKYIRHVHIASPTNNRAVPVADDGDNAAYEAFFAALAEADYPSGYISVEGGLPEGCDAADRIQRTYAYLQGALAPYQA